MQHPADGQVLLIAGEDRGVLRTTDGGATWSMVRGLASATVYSFRASTSGDEVYAAGWGARLWRSTDRGASWEVVWYAPEIEAFLSVYIQPEDPRHLLVGTVARGVFESLDHGASWRPAGLEGGHVIQIERYP